MKRSPRTTATVTITLREWGTGRNTGVATCSECGTWFEIQFYPADPLLDLPATLRRVHFATMKGEYPQCRSGYPNDVAYTVMHASDQSSTRGTFAVTSILGGGRDGSRGAIIFGYADQRRGLMISDEALTDCLDVENPEDVLEAVGTLVRNEWKLRPIFERKLLSRASASPALIRVADMTGSCLEFTA